MTVYHVCSYKQLEAYVTEGKIKRPVRAWDNSAAALKFARDQKRPVVLLLDFPDDAKVLESHRGQARVIYRDFPLPAFW